MLPAVRKRSLRPGEATQVSETQHQRLFFAILLPLGVLANLGLGVAVLSDLRPQGLMQWALVSVGAFCCVVAGWLAAAAWSKAYWNRTMARQVAVWRRISDTIFTWIEDVGMPDESLHRLKTSLDEAVPGSKP